MTYVNIPPVLFVATDTQLSEVKFEYRERGCRRFKRGRLSVQSQIPSRGTLLPSGIHICPFSLGWGWIEHRTWSGHKHIRYRDLAIGQLQGATERVFVKKSKFK